MDPMERIELDGKPCEVPLTNENGHVVIAFSAEGEMRTVTLSQKARHIGSLQNALFVKMGGSKALFVGEAEMPATNDIESFMHEHGVCAIAELKDDATMTLPNHYGQDVKIIVLFVGHDEIWVSVQVVTSPLSVRTTVPQPQVLAWL